MTFASPLPGGHKLKRRNEFEHSPLLAYYEVTQACDLACRACRREPHPEAADDELNPELALRLIEQLAAFDKPPMLVLTGGDPFKRSDLEQLVRHAVQLELKVAVSPAATPQATAARLADLKALGLARLWVCLDGATAQTHDDFHGTPGSYDQTLRVIHDAISVGLPVQVNTTLTRHNMAEVDAMAQLLAGIDVMMWSVSFFIPQDAETLDERITGQLMERVFSQLWAHSQYQPFAIKVHDAPHYRRYVQRDLEMHGDGDNAVRTAARYGSEVGTNDGKGMIYISASGEIFPSAFLPLRCGQFPHDSVVAVYQDNELLKALRNEDAIAGKCGICQYRSLCGGSRARAYALTGDPLAAEPDCPGGFPECRRD